MVPVTVHAATPDAAGAAHVTAKAAYSPPLGAVFNRPSAAGRGAENAIHDHLIRLIANTPARASIRVVMYHFSERPVADALVAADDRGVNVQVILDSTAAAGVTDVLRRGLSSTPAGSWVRKCKARKGCIGSGINHNKFFLFTKVGDKNKVVVQSSANMTFHNRTSYWNNAVTIAHGGLYDAYVNYFNKLRANIGNTRPGFWYTGTTAGPYKLYTFPRNGSDARTDTAVNVLQNVHCGKNPNLKTRIRVAQHQVSRDAIARELVRLKKAGCNVYLAFTHLDFNSSRPAVPGIIRGRLSGTIKQCRAANQWIHSKYMTIETGSGDYAGMRNKKFVFTGSHNFSNPALRTNDETWLRIDGPAIYRQYENNFDGGVYKACPKWDGRSVKGAPQSRGAALLSPQAEADTDG
ncbi:phospholipase D-like domain-containing protein [Thermomonospora umbrina]|uniref:phospholipase D-like domain-containing protein n=1 Tax=Thermomonospora umbrina TaxID=111806 RepID=UPI000E2206F1|nr:phospholipase D-like domain-containing protein [Thermomonospora umbrina]